MTNAGQAHTEAKPAAGTTAPAGLGRRTFSGMIWLAAQTLGTKLAGLISQLVLAWLLQPADFGLVGLALTVTAFATLIQQAGLNEILVQRSKHFARWGNVAFWMSLTLAVSASAIMLIVAPLAAHLYHQREIIGLIAISALAAPLGALTTVPRARLQADLNFRAMAVVNFTNNAGQAALSVLFAALHCGAYSFLLPIPVVNLIQAAWLWKLQRRFLRPRMQLRRWKFMLADSSYIFIAWIFYAIVAQGDYISLGLRHTAEVVGIYFFGFKLSIHMISMFTLNVMAVLLPTLSKLQDDPVHQKAVFLRTAKALAILGMPFGLLLVATASPVLHLFFAQKWEASIRVVQLLSLGTSVSMVGAVGNSLLQSRGQFRTLMNLSIGAAALFVLLVVPAALPGTADSLAAADRVAAAVGFFHLTYGPTMLYAGLRTINGSWRNVADIYLPAAAAGIISIGGATVIANLLPRFPGYYLAQIVLICALGLAGHAALVRWFAPETAKDVLNRIRPLREKYFGKRADPAACTPD
jgi:O-antigen/teichoic acid export membrane protein